MIHKNIASLRLTNMVWEHLMRKFILLFVMTFGIIGCASVPMGDEKENARLKDFPPTEEGKAGIYIYRNESFGAAVTMDVEIDGSYVGKTVSKTYLYKEVSPGKHTITSSAENLSSIDIVAKQGTLSYIWQEVKMGFMYAGSKLHLVSEGEGKKGVLESNLAQTN